MKLCAGHLLATIFALVISTQVSANPEYNVQSCSEVLGTMNIHWELLPPDEPCTGIEYTDGKIEDAADGSIVMSGTGVSNGACIGTAAYDLSLSDDGLTLSGFDTFSNVPMTLTRTPTQECFVGHWTTESFDYLAHISAAPFTRVATASIPALSTWAMILLAGLLPGLVFLRRRLK